MRNSRLIKTDWIYVAAKTLTAVVLLCLLQVPAVPLIAVYLCAHELITTWLRGRLAAGETAYKPAYLFMIVTTVAFWTALACWLWERSPILGPTSATGILLSAAMLGAMRGYRDRGFLIATCLIPLGALLVLTIGEVERLNDVRNWVLAAAPLLLGIISLVRSVVGMRHRDEVVRQATTERNRLFSDLEQANSRLEQVADLSGVAGWDIDLPSRACKLSPAAMKMLGLTAEPASLETLLSHFTPESSASFQMALRDARRFGKPVDVDVQMTTRGDTPCWIRLVGTIIDGGDGTSRFVGAMQDLSERIAALERARQEEVDSALSRLSSRAAAEFKKDLNDVSRSLAELGKRSHDGTIEHALLQGMRLSLNRALDTAQSLQAFGANNPIEPGVVSLQKCISDIVVATSRLLPSNISLTFRTESADLAALLDPAELELSLLHLILNARDSMENGGELTIVSGLEDSGMPFIEIRDTGVGMRPEVQTKIFEPFFTTKRAAGARGLGLSIVRGFVEQARGRLDVKSEPGVGSTFRMVFPQASSRAQKSRVGGVSEQDVRGTILLVHEDEKTLQLLGPALLQEGLVMHYARTARDSMSMLEGKVKYDGLLLSDVQAKSLPGQAMIARLPRQWPQTKIAVLSDAGVGLPLASSAVLRLVPASAPSAAIAREVSRQIWGDSLSSSKPA